jgi:hypothetical protein
MGEFSDKPPVSGSAFRQLVDGSVRIVSATLFTSKVASLQCGMFDERMAAEDFDYHLRLARIADFHYIQDPLYYSRAVRGSLGRRPWLWAPDVIRAIEKHKDLLQDELAPILRDRVLRLSASCFQHGGFLEGVAWGSRAVQRSNGIGQKSAAVLRVAIDAVRCSMRYWAVRLLPDRHVQHVRQLKARLTKWRRARS